MHETGPSVVNRDVESSPHFPVALQIVDRPVDEAWHLAVRVAESLLHPTVFTADGAAMTSEMFTTFLVALAGMLCLGAGMITLELRGKRLALRIREVRRRLEGTNL